MPGGENTEQNTDALRTPAHGRGKLASRWKPGQSGNPGGRPRGTRWLRFWCRRLLAHHGLEVFAFKVKQGDMGAIRLALAYAYGPPPIEAGGEDDDAMASTAVLDMSAAEAAIAPKPAPRPKTREEELEDIVLETAQAERDRKMRLRAAGVTEADLEHLMEMDRQARRTG
jgi:hypothetical protein